MNKIAEIFQSLDYGPAPESAGAGAGLAGERMAASSGTSSTANGPSRARPLPCDNPANGKKLADITDGTDADVDKAVKAAARRSRHGRRSRAMSAASISMPSRGWCRSTRACSRCSRPWTTASRSARAATSIFRWSRGTSTITPAGPSISSASSPAWRPMACAARSSRGISRC